MPFPVSLSRNPWVFLQREGHPKVVADSDPREGHLAELIELFTQELKQRLLSRLRNSHFACGSQSPSSHLTLLEQSTTH